MKKNLQQNRSTSLRSALKVIDGEWAAGQELQGLGFRVWVLNVRTSRSHGFFCAGPRGPGV